MNVFKTVPTNNVSNILYISSYKGGAFGQSDKFLSK